MSTLRKARLAYHSARVVLSNPLVTFDDAVAQLLASWTAPHRVAGANGTEHDSFDMCAGLSEGNLSAEGITQEAAFLLPQLALFLGRHAQKVGLSASSAQQPSRK